MEIIHSGHYYVHPRNNYMYEQTINQRTALYKSLHTPINYFRWKEDYTETLYTMLFTLYIQRFRHGIYKLREYNTDKTQKYNWHFNKIFDYYGISYKQLHKQINEITSN